jgi:DNA polymerase III epsilon subunit-like protein
MSYPASPRDHATQQAQALFAQPFVIFDVETTGLDAHTERIVELAIIDHTGAVLLETLVNPQRRIPARASAVHGIYDADVAAAPTFAELYPAIRALLHERAWAGYNLPFDQGFLRGEVARAGLPSLDPLAQPPSPCCAMRLYARYCQGTAHDRRYRWYKLRDACAALAVEVHSTHRAAADCLLTLGVLRALAAMC